MMRVFSSLGEQPL